MSNAPEYSGPVCAKRKLTGLDVCRTIRPGRNREREWNAVLDADAARTRLPSSRIE
jgi:hypothetical protein